MGGLAQASSREEVIYDTNPDHEFGLSASIGGNRSRNKCGGEGGGYESQSCQCQDRCFDVLSQLLDGIARTPLQSSLQEMRVLLELLGFLLNDGARTGPYPESKLR